MPLRRLQAAGAEAEEPEAEEPGAEGGEPTEELAGDDDEGGADAGQRLVDPWLVSRSLVQRGRCEVSPLSDHGRFLSFIWRHGNIGY